MGCQVSTEVSNSCHVSAVSACRINPPASCRLLSLFNLQYATFLQAQLFFKAFETSRSEWECLETHKNAHDLIRISYIVRFRLKGPKNILRVYFCTVLVCARDKHTLLKMKSPHHVEFLSYHDTYFRQKFGRH